MTACVQLDPLTARQAEFLAAIKRRIAETHLSPTLQELADELGTSKVTVHEHVNALQRKGYITRARRFSRSIRVVGEKCPLCGK